MFSGVVEVYSGAEMCHRRVQHAIRGGQECPSEPFGGAPRTGDALGHIVFKENTSERKGRAIGIRGGWHA